MNNLNVLVIDDNPGDIRLTMESLKGIDHSFHSASTGLEGLNKIKSMIAKGDPPNLILLDINMPEMDGKEFLQKMKEDKGLSVIPVIILTTSNNQSDINECYRLSANAYVVKNIDLQEFNRAIKNIGEFWQSIAKQPEIKP